VPGDSIDDLVEAILSDDPAAWPRRSPEPGEVLSVLRAIWAGTDQADAVMPDVAARLGVAIACAAGCPGGCCESLVLVSVPEAWAIAAHLREAVAAPARAELERRARDWSARSGPAARAAAAWARGDEADYLREMRAHGRLRLPCPFQVDRRCAVYPVRPLRCRQSWAADSWRHCAAPDRADAPTARLIAFPAMDALYDRADRVLTGLQQAVGHGVARAPLPIAVLAALAAGEPR
jgi:Fe-S-cluster containining protein